MLHFGSVRGTIFGNIKKTDLGLFEITFTDNSTESKRINSSGTTIFESKGAREPYKIKIFDKEYRLNEFPAEVDLGNGQSTLIYQFNFVEDDATIILIGLEMPERPSTDQTQHF